MAVDFIDAIASAIGFASDLLFVLLCSNAFLHGGVFAKTLF